MVQSMNKNLDNQKNQSSPSSKKPLIRDDSLEYFIKFPTPSFGPKTDNCSTVVNEKSEPETNYIFVHNEVNIPIVLLLGWAGCQDRYLMKYSKIYEDRGLITVRYSTPAINIFWKRDAMKPIGEKILKLIYDMNFDSHPLIFHIFSNGGAYIYQHILVAMEKSDTPVQVRGVIFDSAPGDRRFMGLYRAISAIYDKRPLNRIVSFFITIGLLITWFFEDKFSSFKSILRGSGPIPANPFRILRDEENHWPQLFLYSKQDQLIPHTDVENFAMHRQNRGVSVHMACFEEAEHVKLFIKYPEYYIKCVCKFINDCLAFYKSCSKTNVNTKKLD